ncbi:putative uncharacterized protein [Waddlia chondrophila 2032/99]|uniref:Uncharacterized protein n=2 Tax=Waddlia chondrophila TaxID=71667 RepID=D6YRL7_WADCW|nr:hypothetical protein [Waddlia chondrophila]ADI38712.1 hypothetical protein wcw_1361 [Waddlia chondrophila WSU 86-1044]CCB92273.1 putative uncharacterized protein [Waddlia chondrophila 2032/99]
MKLDDFYQFIFHPWSSNHSLKKQISATIVDIALTIFSGLLFLIPFAYFQWKDRHVKVVYSSTATSKSAEKILKSSKEPSQKLSPKAQKVKNKQYWQLKQFEKWAAEGQWNKIHQAHYDWWMYPISRSSQGQGTTYAVNSKEIAELKADQEFMQNYLRGVELGAKAWGWDIHLKKPVDHPSKDQKWQNWDVRLGKMADSLHLFGQHELRDSMRTYALNKNLTLEEWVWKTLEPAIEP